jgi:SAM-dependent methyltransferase
MRKELTDRLRCPACAADRSLVLTAAVDNGFEVREGELECRVCAARFVVRAGIVDLLLDPPDYVAREAAGLERFAEVMRADGWDGDRIRQLPYVDLPYWWGQRRAFEYWSGQLPFSPGEWLLDVGANTCWASAMFAQLGLSVVALDIATTDLQGLASAEHFIADGSVLFDRLISSMASPSVASDSMDYVFCCEVLHHNSLSELHRTFRECFRVLRPGGSLLVVNEPLRFPLKPKRRHAQEVADFDGNEHAYFLHQYLLAARRAGFALSVRWPRNVPRPARDEDAPPPHSGGHGPLRRSLARVGPLRKAKVAWRLAIAGDASLNMLCRKPG